MRKKKMGFTLIELIAVLVIMAIIALIVTPLVLNIIRKARISADKRSVDAYGRSIEYAIATYLLDTGNFPTSISDLTIEYSGDEVVCTTTQINTDSSIYLAGCTVGGRSVENYTYGKEEAGPTYTAYSVGDEVTYNNVDYYVIKDSSSSEVNVTLLKKTPLTVAEVNQYGAGHVNMYNCDESDSSCYHTAYDNNGYGGMAYYTSVNCGYGQDSNHTDTGCTTDYAQSEVKYVVDAWKTAKAPAALSARLITIDDLKDNLGYVLDTSVTSEAYIPSSSTPSWVYNSNYWYWTMSQYQDSSSNVWSVYNNGELGNINVYSYYGVVRPVITISKSEL